MISDIAVVIVFIFLGIISIFGFGLLTIQTGGILSVDIVLVLVAGIILVWLAFRKFKALRNNKRKAHTQQDSASSRTAYQPAEKTSPGETYTSSARSSSAASATAYRSVRRTTTQARKTTKEEVLHIPHIYKGESVAYHYDGVNIFIPDDIDIDYDALELGEQVQLIQEPDNAYDDGAVMICRNNGEKLGYLYRNRLQGMVHDFQDSGYPVAAWITSVDDDKKKIGLFIAFYRNKNFDSSRYKKYRLAKNGNENMQAMILLSHVGQQVSYTYDPFEDQYETDVGYFPRSANQYLESEDRAAYICDITENDNGKYVVTVAIDIS